MCKFNQKYFFSDGIVPHTSRKFGDSNIVILKSVPQESHLVWGVWIDFYSDKYLDF